MIAFNPRHPRRRSLRLPRAGPLASALALTMVLGRTASVQGEPGATLNQYSAAPLAQDAFSASRPIALGRLRLDAQLALDYSNDPLVFEQRQSASNTETVRLVSDQLSARIGVSLGFLERFVAFANLPVNLLMEGERWPAQPVATGFGAGDAWLGLRGVLMRDGEHGGLGIELGGTVPTGEASELGPALAGEDKATFKGALLGEFSLSALRVTANVGLRLRPQVKLAGARLHDQLTYALALSVPLSRVLDLHAELFGATPTIDAGQRATSPLEALLGLKLRPLEQWHFGLAAGAGLLRGFGSPDARIVLLAAWQSGELAQAAAEPAAYEPAATPEPEMLHEPLPAPQPLAAEPDLDRDGLPDEQDLCPVLPGAQSSGGCPQHLRYDAGTGELLTDSPIIWRKNSAELKDLPVASLTELVAILSANPNYQLFIESYLPQPLRIKDRNPAHATRLTTERGRTLAQWLVEHGVPSAQIQAYGCGTSRARYVGNSRERAKNERDDWYLIRPLPKLGMRSTLGCNSVGGGAM